MQLARDLDLELFLHLLPVGLWKPAEPVGGHAEVEQRALAVLARDEERETWTAAPAHDEVQSAEGRGRSGVLTLRPGGLGGEAPFRGA